MAANYEFFPTPQPEGSDEVRYHARVVVKRTVSTQEIAQKIARRGAIKEGEVMAVLMDLADALKDELEEGNSVHLDGIGSFRISAHSPSVHSRKEVRAESIKFRNIVYTPEKRLRKQLSGMKFSRVTTPHISSSISEEEIDMRLTEHFQQNTYITTKQMQLLCHLTYATALRRLKDRVEKGWLLHPGHARAPFYFPATGYYVE